MSTKVMMSNHWEDLDVDVLFSNLDELHEDLFVSDVTDSDAASSSSNHTCSFLKINTGLPTPRFHFTPRTQKRKWEELSTSDEDSLDNDEPVDDHHDNEDYFLQYSLLEMKKVIFTPRNCNKKPKLAPENFTKTFIDGLNYGDISELKEIMNKFCASNIKISKKFYPNLKEFSDLESKSSSTSTKKSAAKSSKGSKKEKDSSSSSEEEFIKSIDFKNLNEFFHYMECFNNLIPDGVMSVNDHRCCYDNNNEFIFITSFNFQGTLLSSSSVMQQPQTKWSQNLPFNQASQTEFSQQQQMMMEGSLVLYVNDSGLVDNIEFYWTQC